MYKIYVAGIDNCPMVCIAECNNKIAAMSTVIEFLRLSNVKCVFNCIADPDSDEESFSVDSIPVYQEKDPKLNKAVKK